MDFKTIWEKILSGINRFWIWLKPYLSQFHQWRKRVWKKYHINKIILLVGLIVVLVMSIYLFVLAKSVKVGDLKSGLSQSTVIYDRQGEEAGSLNGNKGTYVDLEEISPYVIEALIATEDRNFYKHNGFDIKGIGRAALRVVTSGGTSGGGGSTITQQLAKNAYLTLDQTWERKAKELFLAIELEKAYSKDEILSMYLNSVYFANGVWGIEDASHKYFGVSAANLSIGEAATLVGMLKGPGIYNPIDYLENAENRRDTVLNVMAETGVLTQEEADGQAAVPVSSLLADDYASSGNNYSYPYYFDAVINEAVERYGIEEGDLLNRGYKVYTELDQNVQQAMETAYENDYLFPENAADGTLVQSGSVALSPKNGGVLGVVGGRGEYVYRGYNYATQAQRSPGSTIKPLTVYTPAIESGYKPDSILEDKPQTYYDAHNYTQTYQDEVTMYEALAQSLNLPAVWLTNKMGLDKGYDKAAKFGLTLAKSDKYYGGVALGGLENGVSPLDMASAYMVFANGGTLYKEHLITKIVDSTGAVVQDNTKVSSKKVISESTADAMTSMMLGTFSNGTGVNAEPYGYIMAGKTGTTETSFDVSKTKDQWVIGYTPDVVISTWLGFDKSSEEYYLEGTSAEYASTVFQAEAAGILPYLSGTPFSVADAYATGGKVVASDEWNQADQGDWQENISDIGEKAKDTAKDFGSKVKDSIDTIGDGINKVGEKFKSFLNR